MKVLLLDIETAPHLATVWGLWKQNVAINQILSPGYTLCWAAKWRGEREVMFDSIKKSSARAMVKRIHKLLDEADAVVHYNGRKFDIPTLNKEFLLYGLAPPSPYHQIDLLETARSKFRLASNKLDFVAQQLGVGKKVDHKGHELWLGCMNRDDAAWKVMEKYNKHDVILLEKVYDALRPWIKGHANAALFAGDHVCPKCGSDKLQARGFHHALTRRYQRWNCTSCGSWSRTVACERGGAKIREIE